jgi:ATP-binding cassette subfamily B (MDR/TAP) protein 1
LKRTDPDPITIALAANHLHHQVRNDLLYLVYLGLATFVATYIYQSAWVYSGDVITRRIREAYLGAVLRQDISYFDSVGAGEVTSRLEADIQMIQEGISDKVPMSCMLISTFISGLVVAYVRSWKLTLVLSAIVPCIIITGFIMNIFVSKLQGAEIYHVSKAATVAEETLAAVRTAKAFGIENKLLSIYDDLNKRASALGFRRATVAGIGMGTFFFIIYSAYALAFVFGAKLVADGDIRAGSVLSVVFSILVGTFSIAMLAPNMQSLGYAASAGAKVFQTIDRQPSIDSSSIEGVRPHSCEGRFELQDVCFHYPSRPDVPVLKNCWLTCEPNQVTALVGASGSGKSTIVSLLERFYDPLSGKVLLDGRPVSSLNIQWLRSQIGLVSQEPTLFATTVRQNIEFGLLNTIYQDAIPSIKEKLVTEAAKTANADDFIRQLPNGYDTNVGSRGFLISGGQKQRIAIARAIISNPRILLLDEATSALDTQSESVVQVALEKASEGRTTIHIAHRLSTIKNADKIIVMGTGGGNVLEQGTHQELIDQEGAYASLVNTQEVMSKIQVNENGVEDEDDDLGISDVIQDVNDRLGSNNKRFTLDLSSTVGGIWMNAGALQPMSNAYDRHSGLGRHRLSSDFRRPTDYAARPTSTLDRRSSQYGPPKQKAKVEQSKPTEPVRANHSLLYLLYRLARINRERLWSLFVPGLLGAAAFGCVYPCFAILLGRTLNNFSMCEQPLGTDCLEPMNSLMRHEGNRNALWFFVVAILATIAMIVQTYCLITNSVALTEKLRRISLHKMLHLDTSYFDEEGHSSGSLSSSLAANASRINGLLGITMGSIIQSISTLISGMLIALIFGWKLSLVVIACIPVTLSAGFIRLKLVTLKDARLKVAYKASAQRACEAVSSIRTVASLTMEQNTVKVYHADLEGPTRMARRTAIYGNLLYALSQSISFWVTALGFWYGSKLLGEGDYTSQQYFTIFTAVVFGSLQAGNVFNYTPDISSARQAANDSMDLLDTINLLEKPVPYGNEDYSHSSKKRNQASKEQKVAQDTEMQLQYIKSRVRFEDAVPVTQSQERLQNVQGELQFQNVHFHYPTRPGVKVLRGMTLTIEPGTSCALVGSSGCGKSTMIQLLERFYDPINGRILLDGHDLRGTDPRELRKHIALVSQEPTLFEGTIAFNILAGLEADADKKTAATQADVEHAAEQANVLSFIKSLPDGFETNVGRAGTQLSGGQKQRIALARALIRNPRILLLDEATSALDSESEKVVQAALDKASQGRTTISIAHRLASIVRADKIICLKDGMVAETGTHEALMAVHGPYSELVAMQGLGGAQGPASPASTKYGPL